MAPKLLLIQFIDGFARHPESRRVCRRRGPAFFTKARLVDVRFDDPPKLDEESVRGGVLSVMTPVSLFCTLPPN
ncbi:hypothetical protein Poly41_29750 [Novipirellula artificiosorum]|uniref:Uncharacterized protein n=1 Tax=Novipirellula artificiosorum TaxID=2528016 RepID=A0A5C6DUQ2_9BACT|nr:hypothetical protein Poly41_29750 [Novipirellula artificiosorum]